jgi:hypothetical protein
MRFDTPPAFVFPSANDYPPDIRERVIGGAGRNAMVVKLLMADDVNDGAASVTNNAAGPMRVWICKDGRTIKAAVVSQDATTVHLRTGRRPDRRHSDHPAFNRRSGVSEKRR